MTENFGMSFGKLISAHRKSKRITQSELAKAAEVTPVALSRLENGKIARPHADTIARLQTALDIEDSEILRLRDIGFDRAEFMRKQSLHDEKRNLSVLVGQSRDKKFNLGDALSKPERLSRPQADLLASHFGISHPETLPERDIRNALHRRVTDVEVYQKHLSAFDEQHLKTSNLKAAARDAGERLDVDEVEALLSKVSEIEANSSAKTFETRAENALLSNRVEFAFKMYQAAINVFLGIDEITGAKLCKEYSKTLLSHGIRHGGSGIQRSIDLLEPAIRHLKAAHEDKIWAQCTQNLAIAYQELGLRANGEESSQFLAKAVETYRDALTVRNQDNDIEGWAITTQNLATALQAQAAQAEGSLASSLIRGAIKAYRDVMNTQSGDDAALTLQNLGTALVDLAMTSDDAKADDLLAEAVRSHKTALKTRTKSSDQLDWATTTYNLASALQHQGDRTSGKDGIKLLNEAIETFQDALSVRTIDQHPIDWALTQRNLASAESALANKTSAENPRYHAKAALRHIDAALNVLTEENTSSYFEEAMQLRTAIIAQIAQLDPEF